MAFVTPDDVKALQLAVGNETNDLDAVYVRCMAKLLSAPDQSATLRGQWEGLKARAMAFVGVSPSWLSTASQMNEGQAIQRELNPWHARFQTLCADVVPNIPPAPPPPPAAADIFSTTGGIIGDLKWIFLAYVAWQALEQHRRG